MIQELRRLTLKRQPLFIDKIGIDVLIYKQEVFLMKILIALLAIPVIILVIAGIVLVIYVRLRKPGKGVTKLKDIKKPEPATAKKETVEKKEVSKAKESSGSFWGLALRWVVVIAVILAGYGASYRKFFPSNNNAAGSVISNTTLQSGIPIDAAAFVVCQCESDGQQFEADKETPLKNKEGSSASGKYQFIEAHRKVAEGLGFDLDTEEGQDGYARYRIIRFGLRDWEADPRSKACIEEKLASMGFKGGSELPVATSLPSPMEFVLIAVGEFSRPLFFTRGLTVETDWVSSNLEKHQIEYTSDSGKVTLVDVSSDHRETIAVPGPTRKIRVKSLVENPVAIRITLMPKT
jgi:hypothetical protein